MLAKWRTLISMFSVFVMLFAAGCAGGGPSFRQKARKVGAHANSFRHVPRKVFSRADNLKVFLSYRGPVAHANEGAVVVWKTVLGCLLTPVDWALAANPYIPFGSSDLPEVHRQCTDPEFAEKVEMYCSNMSFEPETRLAKDIERDFQNRLGDRFSVSLSSLKGEKGLTISLWKGESSVFLPVQCRAKQNSIYMFVTIRYVFIDAGAPGEYQELPVRLEAMGSIAVCTSAQWAEFRKKMKTVRGEFRLARAGDVESDATAEDPWSLKRQVRLQNPHLQSKRALKGFCLDSLYFGDSDACEERQWLEKAFLEEELLRIEKETVERVCHEAFRYLRAEDWPPLERFVRKCDLIILCETEATDEDPAFRVLEEWKGTYRRSDVFPEESTLHRIFWAKTGYLPDRIYQYGRPLSDGQKVVLFHQKDDWLWESMDVRDGRVIYAETDWEMATEYRLKDFKDAIVRIVRQQKKMEEPAQRNE